MEPRKTAEDDWKIFKIPKVPSQARRLPQYEQKSILQTESKTMRDSLDSYMRQNWGSGFQGMKRPSSGSEDSEYGTGSKRPSFDSRYQDYPSRAKKSELDGNMDSQLMEFSNQVDDSQKKNTGTIYGFVNLQQKKQQKDSSLRQRKWLKDGTVVNVFDCFQQQETFYAHCNICDVYTRDYRPDRINFTAHARGKGHEEKMKLAEPVNKKAAPAWWDKAISESRFPHSDKNKIQTSDYGPRGRNRTDSASGTSAGLLPGVIPGTCMDTWDSDGQWTENPKRNNTVSSQGGHLLGMVTGTGDSWDPSTREADKRRHDSLPKKQRGLLPGVIPGTSGDKWNVDTETQMKVNVHSVQEGLFPGVIPGTEDDTWNTDTHCSENHRKDSTYTTQGGLLPGMIPVISDNALGTNSLQTEYHRRGSIHSTPSTLAPRAVRKGIGHGHGDTATAQRVLLPGIMPGTSASTSARDTQQMEYCKMADKSNVPRTLLPGVVPKLVTDSERETAWQKESPRQHDLPQSRSVLLPGIVPELKYDKERDPALPQEIYSRRQQQMSGFQGRLLPGVVPKLKPEETRDNHTWAEVPTGKRDLLPGIIPTLMTEDDDDDDDERQGNISQAKRSLLPGVIPKLISDNKGDMTDLHETEQHRWSKVPATERDSPRVRNQKMKSDRGQVKPDRVQDKSDKVQVKPDKVQDKPDRVQDKSDRVQDKSDRMQDKSERVQNKSDRGQEKSDRVQNKSDRMQNKPDRMQNKPDRVQNKSDRVKDKTDSQQKESHGWDKVFADKLDMEDGSKTAGKPDGQQTNPSRWLSDSSAINRSHHPVWEPEAHLLSKLAALKDWPSYMPARRKLLARHDVPDDQHNAYFEAAAIQSEVEVACRTNDISSVLVDLHKSSLDVAKVNLHALQEYFEMRQPVDPHSELGKAHAFLKRRGYQVLLDDELAQIVDFMWDTQYLLSFLSHDVGSARRKIYTELSPDNKNILAQQKMTHEWLFGGNVVRKLESVMQQK